MAREKTEAQKKNFGVRLNQELMRQLSHVAIDEGKRVNMLIEEAIRDLLKKFEKRK